MPYKDAKIYFSSGTGNSYRVAAWLYDACLGKYIESELIPIDKANPKDEIEPSNKTLVGLAYPTRGLLPPWSMIKFIFKMPLRRGVHLFCIPTRGSFYVGSLLIPGIAGLASILPVVVLLFKGYIPRGSLSFDMPVNIISVHGRLSDRQIERILSGAKRKADFYYEKLLTGKSVWLTLNNLWEYFWSVLLLIYWPLWPIAYLLLGRFFMGRIMFANNSCIGCGTCAKSCPNNAIVMTGKENQVPYWRYNCEHCLRCMNYCKQKAVEAGILWGVMLYYLGGIGITIAYLIFRYSANYIPGIMSLRDWWTIQIVSCVFIYPAYILAYFIFHHLIRIKQVNSLFSFTSLSHFYRRYNEPETILNELVSRKK